LGVSLMLGPIIGAAAAALVAGDPRRIIWTAQAMSKTVPRTTGVATESI
jgi:glycine/D-amino acid oxidase-like deaminating enzyme